jgi:hypothetical protein
MTSEQAEILGWFSHMLQAASGDGGKKRQAGLKPSWKIDPSHEAAMFSHINKWKHGERVDADSGSHPLVHLAWRALAIAWQETHASDANIHYGEALAEVDLLPTARLHADGTVHQLVEPPPAISTAGDGNGVAKELDRMANWFSGGRVVD